MTRRRPPEGDAVPFLTGSDWSMSLNSPTSLGQAQILSALGQKLRERYEPVVKEPLPEHLGALVAQLERTTAESEAR